MRNLNELDKYRVPLMGMMGDEACGCFKVPFGSYTLQVIAASNDGWDHVSVSLPNRCPNWKEMSHIKDLFFHDDECVMQLHPPKSDYVNIHEYCLHLWKPIKKEIPRPPLYMI